MMKHELTRRCENLIIAQGINPGRAIRTHRATTSSRPAQKNAHQQAGYTVANWFLSSRYVVLQNGRRPYMDKPGASTDIHLPQPRRGNDVNRSFRQGFTTWALQLRVCSLSVAGGFSVPKIGGPIIATPLPTCPCR